MAETIDMPGKSVSEQAHVGAARRGPWIPVRDGGIYCSPRCGGKCKWSAYVEAHRAASALCEELGPGWEPRVWENLGWHWESFLKGPEGTRVEVHSPSSDGVYWINALLPQQTYVKSDNPIKAVREMMQEARRQGQRIIDIAAFFESRTGPVIADAMASGETNAK